MRIGVHLIFQNVNRLPNAEKFRKNFKDRHHRRAPPFINSGFVICPEDTDQVAHESTTIMLTKCSCPLRSTMSSAAEVYRI